MIYILLISFYFPSGVMAQAYPQTFSTWMECEMYRAKVPTSKIYNDTTVKITSVCTQGSKNE